MVKDNRTLYRIKLTMGTFYVVAHSVPLAVESLIKVARQQGAPIYDQCVLKVERVCRGEALLIIDGD